MPVTVTGAIAFPDLHQLRRWLQNVYRSSVPALQSYFDDQSGGFYHLIEPDSARVPGDFSKASTATVVNFLARSALWSEGPWGERATDLAGEIFQQPWRSAGLDDDNPFTTSFMLELLATLKECGAELTAEQRERIATATNHLNILLREGNGGIRIKEHPPNAYLTQLAVRVLLKHKKLSNKAADQVQEWAGRNLDRELAILHASPGHSDLFEIAYSVLLLQALEERGGAQRDIVVERDIIHYALNTFFEHQLPDGTWPRSRPLFHYPKVGNAYCYDYELLVQMLGERSLWPILLNHLGALSRAADNLEKRKYPVTHEVFGWSSGHHRHLRSPESWSTASVLHFCYELDRLAAEAVRRAVFQELGQAYTDPVRDTSRITAKLPSTFLDSSLVALGRRRSLKTVIESRFLQALVAERELVAGGRSFSSETPISAIFYGPPGTSKTQLATHIARSIGWPLLKVDPSYLVRRGLENLQAETNQLFELLFEAEEIVVLFDEIDELVRERGAAFEASSRFLTTAMLPKWAGLSERRKIIYLVATNHLELFDVAISRPGRFDMIVPVNPPTARAKLSAWPAVADKIGEFNLTDDAEVSDALEVLTFGEFKGIVNELLTATSSEELKKLVRTARDGAILLQDITPLALSEESEGTWQTLIDGQRRKTRLPSRS